MFKLVEDKWIEIIYVLGCPVKVWFKNVKHAHVNCAQFDFELFKEDLIRMTKEMIQTANLSYAKEDGLKKYEFGKDYLVEIEYLLETREFNPGINWLKVHEDRSID